MVLSSSFTRVNDKRYIWCYEARYGGDNLHNCKGRYVPCNLPPRRRTTSSPMICLRSRGQPLSWTHIPAIFLHTKHFPQNGCAAFVFSSHRLCFVQVCNASSLHAAPSKASGANSLRTESGVCLQPSSVPTGFVLRTDSRE